MQEIKSGQLGRQGKIGLLRLYNRYMYSLYKDEMVARVYNKEGVFNISLCYAIGSLPFELLPSDG